MLSDLTIKGKAATLVLSSAMHASAELTYSQRQTTNLLLTVVDRPPLEATKALYAHLDQDADCTLGTLSLRPHTLATGGSATHPTVELSMKVKSIADLEKRTGGHSWGNTDVSAWATAEIRAVGGVPLVQPGLGEREIERKEPEGDHERPESSHDVLAEMAKQVGAWYYDVGHAVALARPSWLVTQPAMPKYEVVWDDWNTHTDALLAAPTYRVNYDARPWEGRETLTLSLADTDDNGPAHRARPGHILHYTGKAAPADPLWIITEVRIPDHWDQPVTITCWRPVDPPEIVPESSEGGGEGGEAGVPTGPIGQGGWTGDQLKNASEIVREGQRRGLPRIAYVEAIMCAMQESSLRNLEYGDDIHGVTNPDGSLTSSLGLFQQQGFPPWPSRSDRLTPSKAAGAFYEQLVKHNYRVDNANAASAAIQAVQGSAYPYAYAKWWDDAHLVVKACIEAGKKSTSAEASGPLGAKIRESMAGMEGQWVDEDGFPAGQPHQCVDVPARMLREVFGMPMPRANGVDYWRHPDLMGKFTPIDVRQNPRKGDIVSWSGSSGAYRNGSYGHVAIYSHSERGQHFFLTQNPNPARVMPLSSSGILGWMRPIRTD